MGDLAMTEVNLKEVEQGEARALMREYLDEYTALSEWEELKEEAGERIEPSDYDCEMDSLCLLLAEKIDGETEKILHLIGMPQTAVALDQNKIRFSDVDDRVRKALEICELCTANMAVDEIASGLDWAIAFGASRVAYSKFQEARLALQNLEPVGFWGQMAKRFGI